MRLFASSNYHPCHRHHCLLCAHTQSLHLPIFKQCPWPWLSACSVVAAQEAHTHILCAYMYLCAYASTRVARLLLVSFFSPPPLTLPVLRSILSSLFLFFGFSSFAIFSLWVRLGRSRCSGRKIWVTEKPLGIRVKP